MRKDIQHIQLGKREKGTRGEAELSEAKGISSETNNQQPTTNNFLTAENIEVKPTYSKEDLTKLKSISKDLMETTFRIKSKMSSNKTNTSLFLLKLSNSSNKSKELLLPKYKKITIKNTWASNNS